MRFSAPVWVIIALSASAALGQSSGAAAPAPEGAPLSGAAELARAVELLDVPDYAAALEALDRAIAVGGNDRQTLIGIHELRGIVAASLRDPAAALESFKRVVVLDPEFKPSRDYSPRVNGPFLEARAWLAENAPLRFAPLPPTPDKGVVRRVGVAVLSDALGMARSVRFHLRMANEAWAQEEVPLNKGSATVALKVGGTGWWAELLGENASVLSRIGSATQPIVEGDLALTAKEATPRVGLQNRHWWAIGLGGGAVVLAATGAFFGADSEANRARITGATRDSSGVITGITQREAFLYERQAVGSATIANVLFASSVALAGGAAAVWFLGPNTQVTPGGIRGSFP